MSSTEGSIFTSKYLRFSLGILLGAALLYLSIKNVSWQDIKGELESLVYPWIFFAVLLYWLELTLRIARWRRLLAQMKPPVAGNHIALAFISGYAANNVLPAKLGEAFRADLLGRLANVSRLSAFGSIIVERLLDMIAILGMAAWGLFFVTTTQLDTVEEVNRGLGLVLAPVLLLVLAIYFLVARKHTAINAKLKTLNVRVRNLIQGLQTLEDTSSYLGLLTSTLLIWTLNCLAIWSIMMSLSIHLDLNQTILLIGLTGISAAIPAAPAGIGTLQYAFHLTAILFDFPASAALVASAIVQIALLGSATLVGAFAYSFAVSHHLLPAGGARR